MSVLGEWIANCKRERVERIADASIYVLKVGPPRPNQLQTLDNLEAEDIVGLYRLTKKNDDAARCDQERYLRNSDFMPSPESLRHLLGSLNGLRSR
jgi:hypothetical protein